MFAIYIAMHEETGEGQLKNYSVQICGKTEDQGDDSDDWDVDEYDINDEVEESDDNTRIMMMVKDKTSSKCKSVNF